MATIPALTPSTQIHPFAAKIGCPNTSPNSRFPYAQLLVKYTPIFQPVFDGVLYWLPQHWGLNISWQYHAIHYTQIMSHCMFRHLLPSGLHRYWNLFRKPDALAVSFWRTSAAPWAEQAFGFEETRTQLFSSIHQHINSTIWEWGWLTVMPLLCSHKRKPDSPILLSSTCRLSVRPLPTRKTT